MKTLVVRADASAQIGAGHVMRCLALAQQWQAGGGTVTLVTTGDAPALAERWRAEGMEVVPAEGMPGAAADAAFTAGVAHARGAVWVVVDGYHFDAAYVTILQAEGLCVLYVDDTSTLPHYSAEVVLNQNVYAAAELYAARSERTQLLLGTRYALLRREFWDVDTETRLFPETALQVLVTLGGGDAGNMTRWVVEQLREVKIADLDVMVVLGASNPHKDSVKEAATRSGLHIRLEQNVSDMPARMAWADVAVTGAGSTCWELALMGLPSVVLVLAENQEGIARGLAARGVVRMWEMHNEARQFGELVTRLCSDATERQRMSEAGHALVDGKGAARVVQALGMRALGMRASVDV